MDINVEVSGTDHERSSLVDETVEVIHAGGNSLTQGVENAAQGLVTEQQLIVAHPQEVLIPSTEVSCAIFSEHSISRCVIFCF